MIAQKIGLYQINKNTFYMYTFFNYILMNGTENCKLNFLWRKADISRQKPRKADKSRCIHSYKVAIVFSSFMKLLIIATVKYKPTTEECRFIVQFILLYNWQILWQFLKRLLCLCSICSGHWHKGITLTYLRETVLSVANSLMSAAFFFDVHYCPAIP